MPNLSFILPLLGQSVLLPCVLALIALLALRKTRWARFAPLLAVAAGFLASYFAVYGTQWSFPPHQSLDWLTWIVLLGAVSVAAVERAESTVLRHGARLILSLACAALVAWPALASRGWLQAVLPIAATGLLMAAFWSYLAATARQRPTPALMLAVVAGGAGLALTLDASQLIGQLNGALAVTLLTCLAWQIGRARSAFSAAATGLAVILLGTLLANAYFYAGFSLVSVLLLLSGLLADPLVAGVNHLRQRPGGVGSWLVAGIVTAIPVLATIGLAVRAAQESGGY